ncbi:hypothetical protein COV20_01190 [Candidatus Woesearchaeota archaeon CG10_big_fil_rev_8_21_14_0_10_45_16]|nr:MAG: hypothetical protein COV20_01190 [Candidatus Woesearchaeota archaeon CG10_big_fil_rev_8_21_14_0_10_45_16]
MTIDLHLAGIRLVERPRSLRHPFGPRTEVLFTGRLRGDITPVERLVALTDGHRVTVYTDSIAQFASHYQPLIKDALADLQGYKME